MERMELDVLMIRINGCMGSGRYAEARRMLEQVLVAEPSHGVAHGMMGWICWALLDDHERALVHFRCAVRWAPGHVNTWMHYLGLLAGDGREEELHAACQRALAVPGIDRSAVHALVANFLERSGRRSEALAQYRFALQAATSAGSEQEFRAQVRRLRRRAWLARLRS
jgi:tetratricopeptide (TPR) repeat protein